MPLPDVPAGLRIGVFGGAFDPPHNAHVAMARAALKQVGLDTLYIVPTGQAWHKSRELTAPHHRLAMAQLAFENEPRVVVDDRETRRAGPSFTVDTLEALQAENLGAQLYLFMGADQFAAFKQWHRWQEILELAIICIADRAQSTRAQANFEPYPGSSEHFLRLQLPLMPVSATEIRQLMASGAATAEAVASMVPEPVARYISLHQLYSSR
jgi:nicotinate-nucleotide adenylyltransferase